MSLSTAHPLAHPLLGPAYYLEQYAFNKNSQLENKIQKQVIARITALVAPVLFIYQAALHAILAVGSLGLYTLNVIKEGFFYDSYNSTARSLKSFVSSFFEAFPKFFYHGPDGDYSYLKIDGRYSMISEANFAWS